MKNGLSIATLANFKKNRKEWTAFLEDGVTKVTLSLDNLKIYDGGGMRPLGNAEPRPRLEQKQAVCLEFADSGHSTIVGWGPKV